MTSNLANGHCFDPLIRACRLVTSLHCYSCDSIFHRDQSIDSFDFFLIFEHDYLKLKRHFKMLAVFLDPSDLSSHLDHAL